MCVQSVVVDYQDSLLDTGNPYQKGVIQSAPKLLQVNLQNNQINRIYTFDSSVAHNGSYLNDVRRRSFAYLTDSRAKGAIVVLDLDTGVVADTEVSRADGEFQPGMTSGYTGKHWEAISCLEQRPSI